jgi:hypothetical protein
MDQIASMFVLLLVVDDRVNDIVSMAIPRCVGSRSNKDDVAASRASAP